MSDIKEITEALIKFRNERDWEQFHNPKDLDLALNIEAGELLENFLWKSHEEANKEKVKESWARGVQWDLTRMIYSNYRAPEIRPKYTLVVMDLIDNDNRFGNTFISGEALSGYTIRQIEDAINGQKSWGKLEK